MRAVLHLATNSLAGRRGRSTLLVFAVALATALVVAVAAAAGTVAASAELLFAKTTGLSDLRVKHRYNGRLDASLVETLSQWPEVAMAVGSLETGATVRRLAGDNPPEAVVLQGVELDRHERVAPPKITSGRMIHGDNEIVLDSALCELLGAQVGDEVEISLADGQGTQTLGGLADRMLGGSVSRWLGSAAPKRDAGERFVLVGILDRPKLKILQRPLGIVALARAQVIAGAPQQIDTVELMLRDNADSESVEEKRAADLPPDALFRGTAAATANVRKAIVGMRVMLSLITMIVFLSAGFIITTSLTTAVTERMRELAILRCIGTPRITLAVSQILSGVMLSSLGGLIGLPIGLAMAYFFYRSYADTLIAGYQPNVFGVLLAILASVMAGLIGGIYPAVRAAQVRPLQALAIRSVQPTTRGLVFCFVLGVLFISVQPLVLLLPVSTDAALAFYLTIGLPLTFTGYFLLAVPILVLLTKAITRPLAWLAVIPRDVLRQSVVATPYRHGFTAGALMVGLAMLVAIWTGGRSLMTDWFDTIRMPDGFACRMGTFGLVPLTDAEFSALKRAPGITAACPTAAFPVAAPSAQFGAADMGPGLTLFVSFDPDSFFDMTTLTWVQGDAESAQRMLKRGRAVLVSREYLKAHNLGVGSKLTLQTVQGPVDFDIAGVITSPGLDIAVQHFGIHRYYAQASVSSIFGSRADAARYFDNDQMNLILITFQRGMHSRVVMENLAAAVPGITATSAREIRDTIRFMSDRFLQIASAVSMTTLLIACFGVGNMIVAGIASRQFEYGVLRAVGASRWMPARLVLAETVLLAFTASIAGAMLGVQLALIGRVFHGRLLGLVYGVHVPWDVIAWGSLAVLALALLAAILPAIRLARTPPRVLLATE